MSGPPPSGSVDVIGALVENHRRFLAFVERRVGSRQDAEEIVQTAFVRGLERAGQIEDHDRVVAWFYQVLRNAIVDHWRGRAIAARAEEEARGEWRDATTPPPELEAEICGCFEPLIPTLKREYAQILQRVDLAGERPVEVAEDLGITANNAMVRLHRARRALRDALVRSCRTCAEHGCLDCSCGSPASPPGEGV
ncbi:MAG: sigma-70 family RNA polymerase sigma factor [Thermoanaerobaculia bacterium]|nr:sigma-70 family RNA polymerase sigma factor [Thermoanaerobaculia bacterium]